MIDPNLMNGKSNQSKSDVFARVQNNAPKKDVGCSIEGSRTIMTVINAMTIIITKLYLNDVRGFV